MSTREGTELRERVVPGARWESGFGRLRTQSGFGRLSAPGTNRHQNEEKFDGFVRELTFGKRLYEHFL